MHSMLDGNVQAEEIPSALREPDVNCGVLHLTPSSKIAVSIDIMYISGLRYPLDGCLSKGRRLGGYSIFVCHVMGKWG